MADALGKEPKIVYYNPQDLGLKKGEGFPFRYPFKPTHLSSHPDSDSRTVHFFASSDKAKAQLGWTPQHSFTSDVKSLCDDYIARGRQNKDIDFSVDDKILAAVSAAV